MPIKKKLSPEERKQREKERRWYNAYGLTYFEWLRLYESQLGLCAICEQTEEVCGKLCVDHIHVKGFKKMKPEDKRLYVRGLICFLCNTGIKGFDKTVDGNRNRQRLLGTIEYFNKYPLKGEI